MHQIHPYRLWIGNASEARDSARLRALGIAAVIDLAVNEPPPVLSRELMVCRFPLHDGTTNPAWLLRAAINAVVGLVQSNVPTIVCCSAGMSRAPSITAAALAKVTNRPPGDCLAEIAAAWQLDVSSGLWACACAAIEDNDLRF
ncbi:MAG: dual specificity protein phosphatase family protein [Phycisphaeraceae bacterium]|nr:dual specificity protein phosphatase family protein [Phycisphaeraceae bacterium]